MADSQPTTGEATALPPLPALPVPPPQPSQPSQQPSQQPAAARPRAGSEPGLGIVIALAQTIGTGLFVGRSGYVGPFGYVLLAFSGLALSSRRSSPGGTLFLVTALTVAYYLMGYQRGLSFLALIVAGMAAVVGFFGFMARMAREEERLQKERRRRKVSEERLRVARELHDVLGHHLSLINVRAGVGLHLMDRQPDQARTALETIRVASSEALREVRSVLDLLYPDDAAAPRAPAPGLDRLGELTDGAGLPVRTVLGGIPRPLPAEIDRAGYRIVQEALTNVRRHAGLGALVTVSVDYRRADRVVIEVEDDGGQQGPVDASGTEGTGIVGMRERAEALGGSLTAGPLPDGGWRIQAVLPLPEADETGEVGRVGEAGEVGRVGEVEDAAPMGGVASPEDAAVVKESAP
jgi:signal transduction histidine kinase